MQFAAERADGFCPWNDGRYEPDGGPEGAVCRTSEASPHLILTAADLASAYLGAVRFTTLAHARRVAEGTVDRIARCERIIALAK